MKLRMHLLVRLGMMKSQHKNMKSKLYNGEVALELDGRHCYWAEINGKSKEKVIGVTSVSGLLDKPQLKFWAVNLACDYLKGIMESDEDQITFTHIEEARGKHTQRLKEAGDSGTLVHSFAEAFIRSKIEGTVQPDIPQEEQVFNGALAFMRWVKEHNVEFCSTERLVYSMEHGFGGMMDAEAVVDGKKRVIDFKTSKAKKGKDDVACTMCGKLGCGGTYDEFRFQTAAYRAAAEEEGSRYTGDRMIVTFDKDTADFSVHELDGYEEDRAAFLGLLAAKKRLNQLK